MFESMIYLFQGWQIDTVILPFILIFAIVFAVLEKTHILGKTDEQARRYGTVVSLVIALSVVFSHFQGMLFGSYTIVQHINRALPGIGLLLVAIVMMLLTIGLWTGKKPDGSKGIGAWFTLLSGIIVIGIFLASFNFWNVPYWLTGLLYSPFLAFVIAILVFGLIIKFIAGPGKKDDSEKTKRGAATQKLVESFLAGDGDNEE